MNKIAETNNNFVYKQQDTIRINDQKNMFGNCEINCNRFILPSDASSLPN